MNPARLYLTIRLNTKNNVRLLLVGFHLRCQLPCNSVTNKYAALALNWANAYTDASTVNGN